MGSFPCNQLYESFDESCTVGRNGIYSLYFRSYFPHGAGLGSLENGNLRPKTSKTVVTYDSITLPAKVLFVYSRPNFLPFSLDTHGLYFSLETVSLAVPPVHDRSFRSLTGVREVGPRIVMGSGPGTGDSVSRCRVWGCPRPKSSPTGIL